MIRPIGVVDSLARLSLALGLLGLCCGVAGPFAVLLGFLSLGRIAESGGAVHGRGIAIGGIVLGGLETALVVVGAVAAAASGLPGIRPQ